ncbi:MAG: hypothetical protein JW876_02570 [Candidatus Krumholzibacteriota bacterium]|nr:hypothetical protein [Candidatus Krumholzibacteriota bacterium]
MKRTDRTRAIRQAALCFAAALLLAAIAPAASAAQDETKTKKPHQDRTGDFKARLETIAERLALTDEQREPVFTILREENDARAKAFTAAREQGRDGMKALRERMQALRAETETRLAGHLTEEQMAEYRKFVEEERKERESRRGGGRGGGRPS